MKELQKYITDLRLEQFLDYVIDNNESYNNPYHNNYHLQQVCSLALSGCDYYKIDNQNKRLVAVAALFHDFNHTGTGKDDDKNILISIEGFLKFNLEHDVFLDEEVKVITNLIKATRYPYITTCESLTQLEKILRDSDIVQGIFSEDYLNRIVFAIAKEAGISNEKMPAIQIGFLKSTTFCTEWATNLYSEKLPEILKLLENEI